MGVLDHLFPSRGRKRCISKNNRPSIFMCPRPPFPLTGTETPKSSVFQIFWRSPRPPFPLTGTETVYDTVGALVIPLFCPRPPFPLTGTETHDGQLPAKDRQNVLDHLFPSRGRKQNKPSGLKFFIASS